MKLVKFGDLDRRSLFAYDLTAGRVRNLFLKTSCTTAIRLFDGKIEHFFPDLHVGLPDESHFRKLASLYFWRQVNEELSAAVYNI